MSVFATMLATAMEAAEARLRVEKAWPDPTSGLAYRALTKTGYPIPDLMTGVPLPRDAIYYRRSPNLAAYGYVLERCGDEARAVWLEGIEHLRGREIYPADRQSFIFNPVEILGVAAGIEFLGANDEAAWLADTIVRGFKANHFRTPLTATAARVALRILGPSKVNLIQCELADSASLSIPDLLLISTIQFAFGDAVDEPLKLEEGLAKSIVSSSIAINDTAEAVAILVTGRKVIDRSLFSSAEVTPTDRIVGLCRRFPLFAQRLTSRQRGRAPFSISDEYDVQDLLHAILKLHFDDVRPEEYTPSYAGNSSRVDFLLPRERIVVEAKMTRPSLDQKKVADELIIDAARYSSMEGVETLICLVFDPDRRCGNPKTLEHDVENSGVRLKVKAIVCPQGL